MEARWKELLEQDITKELNMEVSEEELLENQLLVR